MQLSRGRLPGALTTTTILASFLLGSCSEEPFHPIGNTTRIETAKNVRQRLETILADEAASAGDEIDATEAVVDGILPGLSRKLSRSVENLHLPSPENADLFAERVKVYDIAAPDHFEHVDDYELSIGHWDVLEGREVERENLDIWAALLDSVQYFENSSFKVVRGEFTDEEQTILHTLMKFNALASRESGYRYAHGKVYVDWVRVDEGEEEHWKVKGWKTKHIETHDVEQLFFSDVLPEALDPELYAVATERSIDVDKRIAAITVNLENDRTQEDVRLHLDDGLMPFSR